MDGSVNATWVITDVRAYAARAFVLLPLRKSLPHTLHIHSRAPSCTPHREHARGVMLEHTRHTMTSGQDYFKMKATRRIAPLANGIRSFTGQNNNNIKMDITAA